MASLACLAPAWHKSRLDPMKAFRNDWQLASGHCRTMAEINHWSEIGELGQSTAASTLALLTARLVFAALAETEQLSAILAGFEDLLPSGVRGT